MALSAHAQVTERGLSITSFPQALLCCLPVLRCLVAQHQERSAIDFHSAFFDYWKPGLGDLDPGTISVRLAIPKLTSGKLKQLTCQK